MKKKLLQFTAQVMLLSMGYQLVFPVCAYALTTGPSQPEVQSFEPVGTTELVDMFTGDFNYNIPLMDVDGYPVNIFYHSGIGMEQEASWVGLGWNINPGEINRTVRGLPDDFNGEKIAKYTSIKPERDVRVGIGGNIALELLGKQLKLRAGLGIYVASNNYRGMSSGIALTIVPNLPKLKYGIEPNVSFTIGVGSQTGADVDFNASAQVARTIAKTSGGGLKAEASTGFNSRTGLKDLMLAGGVSGNTTIKGQSYGMNVGGYARIPIGIQNYVPVITNRAYQDVSQAQLKMGFEIFPTFPSGYFDVTTSTTNFIAEADRAGYGYMYLENGNDRSILDFSRDKDGMYNESFRNLPAGSLAYDLFTVNGQGTGGMFRPYRNDVGTIFDPYISKNPPSESNATKIEAGPFGNLFEIGADITDITTTNEAGPWPGNRMEFSRELPGTLFEKVFFKQAGELTYNQQQDAPQVYNPKAQYVDQDLATIRSGNNQAAGYLPDRKGTARLLWNNSTLDRSSRATHYSFMTAQQADVPEAALSREIISYENGSAGKFYDPKLTKTSRMANPARKDQISEITQTAPDGRRYVYGIPAINHAQREVTFAANEAAANLDNGTVTFTDGVENSKLNPMGRDNFYSSTMTPAYTHSYLLTALLSADYVDILGDGPTDDDLGTYVKYNYTLTDNDYRWRAPYPNLSAQYNPGFWSDSKDGKGSFTVGSRQQWYVRSIETKNYVAEFYTSQRQDGRGATDKVNSEETAVSTPSGLGSTKAASYSYELDSIKMFNKHDRYINKDNAIPVKSVFFKYDYSLCKHVPNNLGGGDAGKLTLKQIFIRYGNSDKNLLSPYTFTYATRNPDYNLGAKDRWGNYKEIKNGVRNYEFPYTDQPDITSEENDLNSGLAGWELTDIKLPSGGKIHVDYESDDYGFVQDKRAMQMLHIEGVGPGKTMMHGNELYKGFPGGVAITNDYVYFKRRKSKENANLSLRDNYLEGQDLLYYSFSLDVIGSGKFEHINGYAKIDEVGYCDNNPASDYGYIKLKPDQAGDVTLHAASIYGINFARYYMPHLFYPGSSESTDIAKIWKGLIASGEELANIGSNPFIGFIKKQKARYISIPGSWIRMQTPNLVKKGGGIRVKKLVLSDSWQQQSGNPREGVYGKVYDYTIEDKRYGTISSGVASYEPLIGGDEIPFRRPVPYSAEKGRLLPSVDLFQEEPMGESFFPGGNVGYSSVKVRSIHEAYGKSSLSEDESLFFTAKDFPYVVEFTDKASRDPKDDRGLSHLRRETRVLQGYAIRLNDMHGKPKAVNNYICYKNGGVTRKEQITGVSYEYFRDAADSRILNNKVMALARQRGTMTNYELKEIILGQDIDMTFDSRFRETAVKTKTKEINVNTFTLLGITIPVFTMFRPDKEEVNTFRSMVSTKIIQQYGLVKSITRFDHGAITKTENLVFDAETGGVVLSRTNNEYGDHIYNRVHPAYLAYEGMRPAYTNTGYNETVDSFVVNGYGDGYLYPGNMDNYSDGDELLVRVRDGFATKIYKLWVLGRGIDTGRVGEPYSDPEPPVTAPPDTGYVTFYGRDRDDLNDYHCGLGFARIEVYPYLSSTVIANGYIGGTFADIPPCGTPATFTQKLAAGDYSFKIFYSGFPGGTPVAHFTILNGECKAIGLLQCETDLPTSAIPTVPAPGGSGPAIRCALKVTPRYKEKVTYPALSDIPVWPKYRTLYTKAEVTVLRSGRRNNLDRSVQQTSFTISPLAGAGSTYADLMSSAANLFGRSTGVLSVAANTYSDSAQLYNGFTNAVISEGYLMSRFNAYVLGIRGNFRPLATYAPRAPRAYTSAHSRLDGAFTVEQPMWLFTPIRATDPTKCDNKSDVLYANNLAGSLFWKQASIVTAYDVLGNALEEQDAIGNYSAAQYGYNQALPVGVASNTRKRHFFTENFEDYAMLKPNTRSFLWAGREQRSPFRDIFSAVITNVASAGYTSEAAPVSANAFSRYGQLFNLVNLNPGGGVALTKEASHTGFSSLKTTSDQTLTWGVAEETADIAGFRFKPGQKYILNLWAKGVSTTLPNTAGFQTKVNSGLFTAMTVKVSNMDSWYMMEAIIDLTGVSAGATVSVKIPSGSYVDDVRALPVTANMKSFVYDPLSFRLTAQLDENHMAAFYEYDQEGLLIRTKKETTTGIITITESRSSHAKK